MTLYLRILRWVRPYLVPVIVSIVITVVYSVLSGASIVMIQPFLRTLFNPPAAEAPPAVAPAPAGGLITPGGLRPPEAVNRETVKWRERATRYLLHGTRSEALWRIVRVLFFVFLAKNVTLYFSSVLTTWVGQRVVKDLRDEIGRAHV
jgi:ABC-type multidrug transport system fused ATPase/permease subunit